MDFATLPVVGEIGPLSDGLDLPFWDGLARGSLVIQRCDGCGTWIWGPQWLCSACHRFDPGWEDVEPTGVVYAWTRTWQGFAPEMAAITPYVTVLVELPHAGNRRLLGLLVDEEDTDPTIGMPVEGIIQPASSLTSGRPVLRWRST